MCGLKVNDKSVADLNPALLQQQPKQRLSKHSLAPKPIGYMAKQNPLVRFAKALVLCATTNYSWSISWHQAAR